MNQIYLDMLLGKKTFEVVCHLFALLFPVVFLSILSSVLDNLIAG